MLLKQQKRQILHVDADAFFASVEQVINPSLKGKPVLVGGHFGENGGVEKGIVSAASYEARPYGIYSGMPMYLAKKKCPFAIVVPGHFDAYREFSRRIFKILNLYTPDVEVASIDEAYLDITGCEKLHKKSGEEIAKDLLFKIYKEVGLSMSCGLASSKTVAKVASTVNKPHKFTVIPYGKERDFLAPLCLKVMPSIGPKTFEVLNIQGFEKLGQISQLSVSEIFERFGVQGIALWKKACGIDNNPVISTFSLPKSISKEHTFYNAVDNEKIAMKCLKELSMGVFEKLRAYKLKARTVIVKVRFNAAEDGKRIFKDFCFQRAVDHPSCLDMKLFPLIKDLFLSSVDFSLPIRLIGAGVSNLVQNYNLNLFQNDDEEEKLFQEIDMVRRLYGEECIRYGV